MTDPLVLPPIDLDDTPAGRILAVAREKALREGYSRLTMDGLAHALGMSKKTLYVHFPSKDAILLAIFEATKLTIRREVGLIIAAPVGFPDKLERIFALIAGHFGTVNGDFLHDLQRFAPHLYRAFEEIKEQNIPLLFGRVLAMGQEQGMVRPDIDVTFLIEYWLQVIKGVHDPDVLARTGLGPREAFERAVDLFFCGLLTREGRSRSRWAGDPASG